MICVHLLKVGAKMMTGTIAWWHVVLFVEPNMKDKISWNVQSDILVGSSYCLC